MKAGEVAHKKKDKRQEKERRDEYQPLRYIRVNIRNIQNRSVIFVFLIKYSFREGRGMQLG
jgi:hypothetical protein